MLQHIQCLPERGSARLKLFSQFALLAALLARFPVLAADERR